MFVVEEKLFTRGEDKLCPAIDALQYPVLEFHASSFGPAHSRDLRSRVRARPLFYGYPGFEPDPHGEGCAGYCSTTEIRNCEAGKLLPEVGATSQMPVALDFSFLFLARFLATALPG